MVTSPLSLEPCSAVSWRGSGRLLSPRDVSPRAVVDRATNRDEGRAGPSCRTPPHSTLATHALRHHVTVLPRGVNVDGEGTGHIGVCYLSQRTEPARRDKAGEIVVSTTRSGRDPNGVPMRGIGG